MRELLVPACLGLAAVILVLPAVRYPWLRRSRLSRLPGSHGPGSHGPGAAELPGSAELSGSGRRRSGAGLLRDPRCVLPVLSGVSVGLLIGGVWSVPVGAAVGYAVRRGLVRMETPAARAERLRTVADLPLAADLLAAALRAGAPLDRVVFAVAEALGGPLGARLDRVARSLRLGGTPPEAWAHLADVSGADRLIAAAVRSSSSGGALSGALTRLADDLRGDRAVAAQAAAQRAGVLIVLPLGLCFLPAFVLAGLVPVVVAVLGDVL